MVLGWLLLDPLLGVALVLGWLLLDPQPVATRPNTVTSTAIARFTAKDLRLVFMTHQASGSLRLQAVEAPEIVLDG